MKRIIYLFLKIISLIILFIYDSILLMVNGDDLFKPLTIFGMFDLLLQGDLVGIWFFAINIIIGGLLIYFIIKDFKIIYNDSNF